MLYIVDRNENRLKLEECGWGCVRIDSRELQEIARFLHGKLIEKDYRMGMIFTAGDLVGKNQIDWENTPLRAIKSAYKSYSGQSTVLGRILKKVLFDLPDSYELTKNYKARYCRVR